MSTKVGHWSDNTSSLQLFSEEMSFKRAVKLKHETL